MNSEFARVSTYGKGRAQIEEETVRAAEGGSRVLVSMAEGQADGPPESEGRHAAIAAWAEALCRDHGMAWRRVGHDVLFTTPPRQG